MLNEFVCLECGRVCQLEDLGNAEKDDKPYESRKDCCRKEQKKQYYGEM